MDDLRREKEPVPAASGPPLFEADAVRASALSTAVHFVDIGKRFQTSIWSLRSASIQRRKNHQKGRTETGFLVEKGRSAGDELLIKKMAKVTTRSG